MILKGDKTSIYGLVSFGNTILLEDGVVIGHPSQKDIAHALSNLSPYTSIDQLYQKCVSRNTEIGNNSIIRSGTVIYSGVIIKENFDCGHNVLIREGVTIGHRVYIKPYTEIMKNVTVGNDCILAGTISDFTTIGNDVASYGTLTHRYSKKKKPNDEPQVGPKISDHCIIGRGAVVAGNVVIGTNSIIGANTFVNFDVPPNSLVIGVKGRIQIKPNNIDCQ